MKKSDNQISPAVYHFILGVLIVVSVTANIFILYHATGLRGWLAAATREAALPAWARMALMLW